MPSSPTTSPLTAFQGACLSALGPEGVVTDPGEIQPFVTDFWRQYFGRTSLVLRPASTEQVASVARLASEHHVALVPQSGNTGLVRGGIPDPAGDQVLLSLQRLNRIRHVAPAGDHLV